MAFWRLVALALCLGCGFDAACAAGAKIEWHGYEAGMARSRFEKKRAFLHFTAEWCGYCREMERKTFEEAEVIAALNRDFIAIRVDTDREPATAALFKVKGLPDSWFIAGSGEVIGHRPGYIPPDQFLTILRLMLAEPAAK
jgi:thioredoxin-related protein